MYCVGTIVRIFALPFCAYRIASSLEFLEKLQVRNMPEFLSLVCVVLCHFIQHLAVQFTKLARLDILETDLKI